jgi:hypothetical protein
MDSSVAAPDTTQALVHARSLVVYLREHHADRVGIVTEGTRRDFIAARAETAAGLPALSGWRAAMLRGYTLSALGFIADGDDRHAHAAAILAARLAFEPRPAR